MSLVICRTPMKVVHRESLGERWCFQCRARVEFVYLVWDTVEPSYYEPNPGIECVPRSHNDGDMGFGRIRDWWGEFE